MKYAILGVCVLGCLCGYFVGQVYYERGRVECEKAQSENSQRIANNVRHIQTEVARTVAGTATADIRRLLREKYTIAD